MSYNGYPNYATWNVQLWLDNDEGLYREYQRRIRRAHNEIDGEFVESVVRDLMPDGTPDFATGAARYKEVDWDHLAESWEQERLEYAA